MEQLTTEVAALREWQARLIQAQRKAARWLLLALVLFTLAVGVGFWRLGDLAEANRAAIIKQNEFDKKLAMEQYHLNVIRWGACRDRNALFKQQLRQDDQQLRGLIAAHTKDGDKATVVFWKNYLAAGQATKLPECGPKPTPPTLEENVP